MVIIRVLIFKIVALDGITGEKVEKPQIYEPLYNIPVTPTEHESKMMGSQWFQRLKGMHLDNESIEKNNTAKTAAKIEGPLTLYQHSLGTFSLLARDYPKSDMLRASALLCCVGDIPFAKEIRGACENNGKGDMFEAARTDIKKEILFKTDLSEPMRRESVPPRAVYDITEGMYKSPLLSQGNIIGADMLDFVIRRACCTGNRTAGKRATSKIDIAELVGRVKFLERGASSEDEDVARAVHGMIIKASKKAFSDKSIASSALLQRAFEHLLEDSGAYKDANTLKEILRNTEQEMINLLSKYNPKCNSKYASSKINMNFKVIEFNPGEFQKDNPYEDVIHYCVRERDVEMFAKTTLTKTVSLHAIEVKEQFAPFTEMDEKAGKDILKLKDYVGTYVVSIG